MRITFVCAFALSVSAAWAQSGLMYSTYLREGFTPAAVATDAAGNLYVTGPAVLGPESPQTAAMVIKLNPTATQTLYVRTLGGSGFDSASAIAVDSAGDAYVAGTASSPDFPITPGSQTGTLPVGGGMRTFLAKFDPQGELLFSDVLGAVSTYGLAVALAADGGIIVSGLATASGLAATTGAYSVPDTNGRPYLMKVSTGGTNIVFSATGIGGDALAVDAAGNIYMAGAAHYYYPTTPGAYQTFPSPASCPECFFADGANQYVTKVDPAATTLLYSTGVSGNGQTANKGLAVDASGNAYVTGLALDGAYPWTGTQPNTQIVEPFLTKLDAAGANAIYSIAVGGSGIALGSQGDLYVGGAYNLTGIDSGIVGIITPPGIPAPLPPGIASLPMRCQQNNLTTLSQAYVSHIDAATGNVLGTVLLDGSNASTAGIAFAGGSSVWLAGPTSQPDVPITPGALTPIPNASALHAGTQPGALLAQAGFAASTTPAAPQVACVTDNANEARQGVVAPGQLLSLFGSGLGPATGVAATNYTTTSLAGVTVTFNGEPAPLLYVSSSQINVAVPFDEPYTNSQGNQNLATVQVTVNGTPAAPRALPVVPTNPNLFANLTGISTCTIGAITYNGSYAAVAINQDGNINSCTHRAAPGELVSFFINGLGVDASLGITQAWTPTLIPIEVTIGPWSVEVTAVEQINPFVWQMSARIPADVGSPQNGLAPVTMDLNLANGVLPIGPLSIEPVSPLSIPAGQPISLNIWVGQ